MAFSNPVVIERYNTEFPLTFAFLRTHGIEMAQQFSGGRWTDFNLHDPGVTILEQLCFALTDLSYRTDFPIEDILANEKGEIDREKNIFIEREKVLSTKPVSIVDFRKYALDDVDEIKNIWIDAQTAKYSNHYMKGLYQVVIQINEDAYEANQQTASFEEEIKTKVLNSLEQVRSLCESFDSIIALVQQEIIINAEIIINEQKSAEEIMAEIYFTFKAITNPSLRYFTEKELTDKGIKVEDIYDGPLLKKGILPSSEMRRRRTQIDPSDLVNALVSVKGVDSVTKISINSNGKNYYNQACDLDGYHYPIIKIETFCNTVSLFKNKFKIHVEREKFLRFYHKLKQSAKREYVKSLYIEEKEGQLKGQYRNLSKYYSIQDHFPVAYGIGKEGILSSKPIATHAKASQLRAYLMLFEQILANYLAQLQSVPNFYAPYVSGKSNSYFFQALYDVPFAADIIKSFTDIYQNKVYGKKEWQEFVANENNRYVRYLASIIESDEVLKKRKNDMMDHLLARFNLSFTSYAVTLFNLYYGTGNTSQDTDVLLAWKADLLQNVDEIIYNRSRASNRYLIDEMPFQTRNFEKNIYLFLYIKNEYGKRIGSSLNNSEVKITPIDTLQDKNANQSDSSNGGGFLGVSEQGNTLNNDILTISDQPISFLVNGLNPKNYSVTINANNKRFDLSFKKPATNSIDTTWVVIGQYTDEAVAYKVLDKTIAAVKKISLDTEGFYLVEHISLRPKITSANFGFVFFDKQNRSLFTQKKWMTFKEREDAIGELLNTFLDNDELEKVLNEYCVINYKLATKTSALLLRDIAYSLKSFSQSKMVSSPAFVYTVKISDQTIIKEEFYNYRMSIFFPSWPARFQDNGFRSFAENVLREYSPAHIQSTIYWLKQKAMLAFEDLYFAWLDALKKQTLKESANNYANELTAFLAKENYSIQPI